MSMGTPVIRASSMPSIISISWPMRRAGSTASFMQYSIRRARPSVVCCSPLMAEYATSSLRSPRMVLDTNSSEYERNLYDVLRLKA